SVANRTRHGTMRPANCTSRINQLFIYRPLALLCHFGARVKGQKPLRKRTIASGGSRASVGKSLRKRQRSPQVGRDRETCGVPPTHRDRSAFPPPSSVFAAQWFPAPIRRSDKVVVIG